MQFHEGNKFARICVVAIILCCTCGCVSQNYFGASVNREQGDVAVYRPISSKYEKELNKFGESCVKAFLDDNAEKLSFLSSNDLKKIIKPDELKLSILNIKGKYGLRNTYAIQKLHGMSIWMDEWNFKNQYDLYEIFISRYLIYGDKNVHLVLFVTRRENGELRLWGIEAINDQDQKDIDIKSNKISKWASPVFR